MTMSETTAAVQTSTLGLHTLEQYERFVGAAAIGRILRKAEPLRTLHLVHISSTFYGGGVRSQPDHVVISNCAGIQTGALLDRLGDTSARKVLNLNNRSRMG
jgi:trehalose synthase